MDPLEADDPRVIGGFRLQARLGAGGMGRVYLGFSPAGRAVAVKVIHPHLARDEAFAARFRREVAAAQAVNTAYAAPAIAAGPGDDPPWMATAFVPAPSLQDVVTAAGPLPEEAVWKLAAGLAEALRAIHACGLVHRDLKPGNVLLAADGPRVIDFGIARVLDGTRLTTTGSVLGTPLYMSPEQAQGGSVDPPSDVFSLGGVMYFAATGQTPFGTGIPATVLYRIVFTEPNLDGLSPQLRSLVAACLDKNPAARPTPAQLAAALMPAASAESPLAASGLEYWPAPVAQFIHEYHARLDPEGTQAWRTSDVTRADTGITPPERPPEGGPAIPRRRAGGRHSRSAGPAAGMGRRRALASLAGAAVAGVGVAGWEFSRSNASGASTGRLALSQPGGKQVPPGTKIWRFTANAAVGAVAAAAGVVYAGTNGNTVFALDAATGTQIWRGVTTSQTNNQMVLAGRSLVISGGTGLYALATGSGRQLWNVSTDVSVPLAVAGDVVYAGIAPKNPTTGGVTAYDASTGALLWTHPFGPVSDVAGGLAVTGGVVYATTSDGEIFALSPADGAVRQHLSGSFAQFGAVAVADGVIYAAGGSDNGSVFAVDGATKRTLWQRDLGKASLQATTLATSNGVVFAGVLRTLNPADPRAGGLYALNGTTGQQLWSTPVPGGVNVAPVVAGDAVYTGSADGLVGAWQASTGNKLWSYSVPGKMGSEVVVAGSRAYFGVGQYVYAFGG